MYGGPEGAVAAAAAPKMWANSKFRARLAGGPTPKLFKSGREEFASGLVCPKQALGAFNSGFRYSYNNSK